MSIKVNGISKDPSGGESLGVPLAAGSLLSSSTAGTRTWVASSSLGLEPGLGVPAADGYMLVSSTAGTRTWVAPGGGGSGLVLASTMDGRLTLTSGTPVTTADVTAASTIYLTPYGGNQVALYDGADWQYHTLTEISLALSGLTSGKNYDVFLWDDSGTLTLELSDAWTDDTTRDEAVTTLDGIRVKDGAPERRLVGTIRTTGTTTTEDSDIRRFVLNERHPVRKRLVRSLFYGATWTYSGTTFRLSNNSADSEVYALTSGRHSTQVGYTVRGYAGNIVTIGVGLDSLTPTADAESNSHGRFNYDQLFARSTSSPAEGYHAWSAVERQLMSGNIAMAGPTCIAGEVLV